jgi:hypothetical protein
MPRANQPLLFMYASLAAKLIHLPDKLAGVKKPQPRI